MARTARTLAVVLASLALLATGCGDDDDVTADTAPTRATDPPGETVPPDTEPPDTEPPGPGSDLDAELVAFVGAGSSGVDVPSALLTSPVEVEAWIGWFEGQSADQAAALRDTLEPWATADDHDPADTVLVAFAPFGCAEDGAELRLTGSDLDVVLTGGEGVDCAQAVGFAVVFAVDPSDLPDGLTLAGDPPPAQAGPGTLVVFEGAGTLVPPSPDTLVLRDADDPALAPWIAQLDASGFGADVTVQIGDAAVALAPDEVAVAAAVQGCADDVAELVLGPGDAIEVEPTGGEGVDCDAPATYVVVLIAPADLLPA